MLQAAIKQREVDERITLDDAQVIAVLEKMVKQRKRIDRRSSSRRPRRPRREGKRRDRAAAGLPARPALRGRGRRPDRRGDRRDRRRVHQGHGQGDGRREGQGRGPRRHGCRRRSRRAALIKARLAAQADADGLLPHGRPHSPDFIDDLVARTDIVELIGSRVPLKHAGREYKACCPFHDEKTPSFSVSPDKQFYHCFGCGAHGTVLGFLMDYDRLGFLEAVEELAARAGSKCRARAARRAPAAAARRAASRARARRAVLPPVARGEAERRASTSRSAASTARHLQRFGIGYAPDPGTTARALRRQRRRAAGAAARRPRHRAQAEPSARTTTATTTASATA